MPTPDDFTEEKKCVYKDETYLVRDNGAVMRLSRENKKARTLDNAWTFGKLDTKTAYLLLASERVHRIIATAFHGEPESSDLIVDHIDTNRQNNRPENLRWVTRLENTILNPITRKRIEYVCGVDIYTFLQDPSKYREKFSSPNYAWMKAVTKEEAQTSLNRLQAWAKEAHVASSGKVLHKWIFEPVEADEDKNFYNDKDDVVETIYINSLTRGAVQVNWITPTEFLCCPTNPSSESVKLYANLLEKGKVFAQNKYNKSIVKDFALSDQGNALYVLTEDKEALKPYALAKITYENDIFVHTSLGLFLMPLEPRNNLH